VPQPAQRRSRWKLRLIDIYPPYLGAGVRVRRRDTDPLTFDVAMKLRWWNRNYFGTHFGGSLYSMCDPFFCLILLEALGPGRYEVWDKAAAIRFRRPGRGTVRARFEIPRERVEEIRAETDRSGVAEPLFAVEVRDDRGELVAEVEKRLHVRRRRPAGPPQ